MRINQLTIKIILLSLVLVACEKKRKYWIYIDTKGIESPINTHMSLAGDELSNKSTNEFSFIKAVKPLGVTIDYYSSWLNAGTSWLSESEFHQILNNDIVKEVVPVSNIQLSRNQYPSEGSDLSFALEQIKGDFFVNNGLNGRGVKIGIIDGGFLDADKKSALAHVFGNGSVKAYKDYLTPNMRQYGGSKGADDGHGTEVWTQIAGLNSDRNVQFGLATQSEFYLARTDDGRKENRREEEYLIEALEWLNSEGVKLVNISLGYSTGFDNPKDDYLPEHIDGQFTAVTRAVNIAAEEKGMLIVVSAGNDGQNSFRVLSAPGDGKGVLTVGATNFKTWDKTNYSSIGPQGLGFLKPNVSCFASNGTSFSAPVITGLAACIMQMDNDLTNYEVISVIERSSHLFPYGNNYVGYGVPSCKRIYELANSGKDKDEVKFFLVKPIVSSKNKIKIKMPIEKGKAVVFHKSDSSTVILQKKEVFFDFVKMVVRPKNTQYTTLVSGEFVREIEWL